jgi:hypothetical protein
MNLSTRRRQFIEGLQAVAKFYEENPAAYYDGMHLTLNMYVAGSAARQTLARAARGFGQCKKVYDDTNITISRPFSKQVTVAVFAPRVRVCRPIQWDCAPLLEQDADS